MFHPRAQTLTLLLGVLVLLPAESHATAQKITSPLASNNIVVTKLVSSVNIIQQNMKKMNKDSSTLYWWYQQQQEKLQQLDLKTENMKNELLIMKAASTRNENAKEFQDLKNGALQEFQNRKEAALQELQNKEEAALNNLQQQVTNHKTYKKYDGPATHSEAIRACRQMGGRLALPKNEEETKQMRKEIGIDFRSNVWSVFYWISGTDQQHEGKWIDNVTGEPLRYTNFKSGQPDNNHGGQDCLSVSPSYVGWDDRQCIHKGTGYLCEFFNE